MKHIIMAIMVITMVFAASTAPADECMRYNHRKICPGNSAFDVINLFGEPAYKSDLDQTTDPLGCHNVEL